jgi:hypothetical protein
LLHIDLFRPEVKNQTRTIDIKSGSAADMAPESEVSVVDVLQDREAS